MLFAVAMVIAAGLLGQVAPAETTPAAPVLEVGQVAAPAPAPAIVAAPVPPPAVVVAAAPVAPQPALDSGLLEPGWFGPGLTFVESSEVDFYWVKPGLDLRGRTIAMKLWEDPAMLKKGRDGKDFAKATAITDSFPGALRGALAGALAGTAKVSRSEGDVLLFGRIVDANAGSKAAKWLIGLGAGSETATWDLKLVDATTRELLMAVHHRSISGTAMTNIDDKLVKWAAVFGTFVAGKAVKTI